ncbi:MAG: DNA alkylation repair protein [Nanoarchaeota archaeon]|nr:DNA alkylation repair protein [Nanoarchaeota archaeon]
MDKILSKIRSELNKNIESKHKEGSFKYFKEEIKPLGVKIPIARKIARENRIKDFKQTIQICEKLLDSGYFEEGIIAFTLMTYFKKRFDKNTFKLFETWVDKYVHNWAWCDFLSSDLIAACISNNPEIIKELKKWTSSENKWKKRSAVVSLVPHARRGRFLPEIFEISLKLIPIRDNMVEKGVGWLLKEASKTKQKEIIEFVKKHENKMTRTTFRYAIEKIPENTRKLLLGEV